MSLKSLVSSVALAATLSNPIHAAEPTTLENKVAMAPKPRPTKAQLEEAVKNNPYCGKPGYECKAEGWDVPSYENTRVNPKMRSLDLCKDIEGTEVLAKYFTNTISGEKFVELSYNNKVVGYLIQTKLLDGSTVKQGIIDVDGDGSVYETKALDESTDIPCPKYITK